MIELAFYVAAVLIVGVLMVGFVYWMNRPEPSKFYLTPNVWKARDEWMARAARDAMEPQLAEIRSLLETRS